MAAKASIPEHKIRTAIKAYLDAGGDPDFYIVSNRLMLKAQTNTIDQMISMAHYDNTTDPTGYTITKHRLAELGSKLRKRLERPRSEPPKGVKF